jgi:hypothetical protein
VGGVLVFSTFDFLCLSVLSLFVVCVRVLLVVCVVVCVVRVCCSALNVYTTAYSVHTTTITLLISHCHEPLHWLEQFYTLPEVLSGMGVIYVHVVEKCDHRVYSNLTALEQEWFVHYNITRTIQPNIGFESHTYLHYLHTHYNKLSDYTFLLQGDIEHHAQDGDINTAIQQAMRDGVCTLEREETGACTGYRMFWNSMALFETTVSQFSNVAMIYWRHLYGETPFPALWLTPCCALIQVSRAVIHLNPSHFYRRALMLVDGTLQQHHTSSPTTFFHTAPAVSSSYFPPLSVRVQYKLEGCIIERMWGTIFHHPFTRVAVRYERAVREIAVARRLWTEKSVEERKRRELLEQCWTVQGEHYLMVCI